MMILKSGKFEHNSLTPKLLGVVGVMLVVVAYMAMSPSLSGPLGARVEISDNGVQTKTYLSASKEMREELEIKREDFEGFYFTLRLINPMRAKVVMVVNGTKLRTIESNKYITRLVETIDLDDKSPFYFVFLSYLMGSLYFPVGTVNFVSNSEGIWYNGVCHSGRSSTFRRICFLLSRDIQ